MTDATLVGGPSSEEQGSPERLMVKQDMVEMVLGALRRGEPVLAVARAYGLDPKTVRAWRRRGQIFVYTLGYSRRCFAVAFRSQRLREWIAGHELAFQHFAGVPDRLIVDNAKAMVLTHTHDAIVWNTTYADFTAYYGVRPWACAPYWPQTKGKVESGVKYVQRNALVGKRFTSWEQLNAWLLEWTTTIADCRVHGTTHEVPLERFAREALTPLGLRPPYQWARVRRRIVATDALVSVAGSRYSVPARLVGTTVEVHESATGFVMQQANTVVASHARRPRRQVVMDPAHYAGLLRVDRTPLAVRPPQYDPRYQHVGVVEARDLAIYDVIAETRSA